MTLSFHKIIFTADDVLDILADYTDSENYDDDSDFDSGGLTQARNIQTRFAAEAERLSSLGKTQYDSGS